LNLSVSKKRGGARAGAGQSPYEPTPADRATVKNLVVCGYPQEQIAACLGRRGISEPTLRKHFRRELDTSKSEVDVFATMTIIELMKRSNLGAACFYLKCRAGWREKPTDDGNSSDDDALKELANAIRNSPHE
jgi:hypothetical protein